MFSMFLNANLLVLSNSILILAWEFLEAISNSRVECRFVEFEVTVSA